MNTRPQDYSIAIPCPRRANPSAVRMHDSHSIVGGGNGTTRESEGSIAASWSLLSLQAGVPPTAPALTDAALAVALPYPRCCRFPGGALAPLTLATAITTASPALLAAQMTTPACSALWGIEMPLLPLPMPPLPSP